MKSKKPVNYDFFREKVLATIRTQEYPYFTREQFLDWKELVYKKQVEKVIVFAVKGKIITQFKTVTEKHVDVRKRNRDLKTLHAVMDKLVKEGMLIKLSRIDGRCNNITWRRRER